MYKKNPKSEARNSKQISMTEILNSKQKILVLSIGIWNLDIGLMMKC